MTENFPALAPYGFTERVHAIWNDRGAAKARPGRVVRVDFATARVACADGVERFFRVTRHVAVGDWVALQDDDVAEVLPRWSAVARVDPATTARQAGLQVLAANVDEVVIAAPADRLKLARIEREVALAWESGARPLLVLTKSDLDDGHTLDSLYARIPGVGMIATSARRHKGLDELTGELAPDRTGLLIGPSGAGKSSLVNALIGRDVQTVGDVRAGDRRGRHTTSSRQLLCLPGGGVLIDTPGLRSLGLPGSRGLDHAFSDIEHLARSCQFRDCGHGDEPDCAVRDAIAEGSVDPARLASFKKLKREIAAERRRADPLEALAARRRMTQLAKDARRNDKRRWF